MEASTVWVMYKYSGRRQTTRWAVHEWLLFLSTPIGFTEFMPIMTKEDRIFLNAIKG